MMPRQRARRRAAARTRGDQGTRTCTPRAQRAKHIINRLASQARVLIGYEGPQANVLKLRPPMPFRPEHADLLGRGARCRGDGDRRRAAEG